MVELALEDWTAAQREGLAFLIDDAEISAQWGPNSVSVPEESRDQVQRFITFLASGYGDDVKTASASQVAANWDVDSPRLMFTDDLGISDTATPGLRLGGALVDGFVFGVIAVMAFLLNGGVSGLLWIQVVLTAGYVILMVGLLGRTLGNIAVHTRVVKIEDRGVPGLRAAVIRWLVPQAGFLLAVLLSSAARYQRGMGADRLSPHPQRPDLPRPSRPRLRRDSARRPPDRDASRPERRAQIGLASGLMSAASQRPS